jgi:hypothetical protein
MPFDHAPTTRPRGTFLKRLDSLVVDGAEGTIIALDRGCVWITLENDPRDVVLVKGMRFVVDRPGRTVIVAEEDSRLLLTPAPTLAQKIVGALVPATKRALARSIAAFDQRGRSRRVPYY